VVGDDVTIGHNATVHGCTVHAGAVIGIGATVLNHATVGEGAVVAAGALVKEGGVVPPKTVVMGVPAKVVREVTDVERERFRANAEHYARLAAEYKSTGSESQRAA
jgi:carbonic anhydrase/acetyltransferase-like protein (isoleucine patch superfamily)